MKAFVEILSGVIRVGPDCEKYGDPFEHAAAFSASAGIATVKALAASNRYTIAHHRAGIIALKKLGLTAHLERINDQNELDDFCQKIGVNCK